MRPSSPSNPDVLREQLPAAGLLAPLPLPLQHRAGPMAEMGNLRRRLNRQSKASPSRFSGREEEEEKDGSGRRAEEEEGAEEKGGNGGGRRRLLRSGLAGRERIRVRASLERERQASPSRFSGQEEEEEQDGSGRRAEEEEGAEEKGGEGGGRRMMAQMATQEGG